MTGDELAGRLFAEQGFLVVSSDIPVEIGSFLRCDRDQLLPIESRCRVVGEATKAEYVAQYYRAVEIFGSELGGPVRSCYFYRLEAAD